MSEIYISMDVEADGPYPIDHSMLSFGAAAFLEDGQMIGTFERNLEQLESAKTDAETMAWWATQPTAWAACRQNLVDPKSAMWDFTRWCNGLKTEHNAKPTFVAYPAGFDFTYIYCYLMKFVGSSIFSFSGIDIKTYAMAMMQKDFNYCVKKNMPKKWFSKRRHTHVALDDALGQGELFINMLKANKQAFADKMSAFIAIAELSAKEYKHPEEANYFLKEINKTASDKVNLYLNQK